jgi:FG-GAP-like repeat/FG-GAP repeat
VRPWFSNWPWFGRRPVRAVPAGAATPPCSATPKTPLLHSRGPRRRARPLFLEPLEDRTLLSVAALLTETEPNDDPAQATLIELDSLVSGAIDSSTDTDFFHLHVAESGDLRISVEPAEGSTLDSRLALFNTESFLLVNDIPRGGGGLLTVSDDRSIDDPNPLIERVLLPGDYFIQVSAGGLGTGTGAYTLSTTFVPEPSPFYANQQDAPGQQVGDNPVALVAADFNRDGNLDLATANRDSTNVSVLLGIGDNGFFPEMHFSLPEAPVAIATADVNSDGRPDLAILGDSGFVSILAGVGDGTFLVPKVNRLAATDPAVAGLFDGGPVRTLFADFNQDSTPEKVQLVSVDGNPEGPFKNEVSLFSGLSPTLHLSAQVPFPPFFIPDVLSFLDSVGVTELFLAGGRTASDPSREQPLIGDFNGDGADDVVTLGPSGMILARLGRPGEPGVFGPSVVVNPIPEDAARTLTLVADGSQIRVAALDAHRDSVSVYALVDGQWQRSDGPTTGVTPVAIASADLDGDGLGDLVVAGAVLGPVSVYLGVPDGGFLDQPPLPLAIEGSGLLLTDLDGDGRPDMVLTNQISGDVDVLINQGLPPGSVGFGPELRYRGGTGVSGVFESNASIIANGVFPGAFPPLYFPVSNEETHSVAVGDFNGDGILDLAATNRGLNNVALLFGKGSGSFVDPVTFPVGDRPTAIQTADFNGDGELDLVVLNSRTATYSIFLGDGTGGFIGKATLSPLLAGNAPTGFSVRDVNGDGLLDLVGGNEQGDVLTLLGNGDGTFQPFQRADRNIALAVADLNGDGHDDFIYANEGLDRLFVDYSKPGQTFVQDRESGLLAPGAVSVADLNGDGWSDLVVANSGGNSILVYLNTGDGQFTDRREFFVGTGPAGMTITDVNGDGVLDVVVANEGSNDVSLLLGQGTGASWTLTAGPRLQAGQGPVAVTVMPAEPGSGPGTPQLIVTNSLSDDVWVLPGRGDGLFSDRPEDVRILGTGAQSSPRQTFVGNFDNAPGFDLVTLNAGASGLSFISGFMTSSQMVGISSGGLSPLAGVVGDFNRDGMQDLVVANNGDGRVSLLFGGGDGLSVAQSLSATNLQHPTALVIQNAAGDLLEVLLAEEGSEAVIPLTFRLDAGIPVAEIGSGQRGQAADLLPLNDTTVAIIPTLVVGDGGFPAVAQRLVSASQSRAGENGEGTSEEDGESTSVSRSVEDVVLAGIGLFLVAVGGDESLPVGGIPGSNPEEDDALKRFVSGVDGAVPEDPPLDSDGLIDLGGEPETPEPEPMIPEGLPAPSPESRQDPTEDSRARETDAPATPEETEFLEPTRGTRPWCRFPTGTDQACWLETDTTRDTRSPVAGWRRTLETTSEGLPPLTSSIAAIGHEESGALSEVAVAALFASGLAWAWWYPTGVRRDRSRLWTVWV